MKQSKISQSSFDNFLANLDSDRERAGQKYEKIRVRIVKFFEWRACQSSDELADETLDRVIKKNDTGEQINDYVNYAYGVARLVYLESVKKQAKEKAVIIKMAVNNDYQEEETSQLNCLKACLQKLSKNNRTLILHYYHNDKQAKIDYRKKLAENLGISINSMRIKAFRIREKLEKCVFNCLGNNTF